ncbi:Gmad2 immunoglobulin-like domain-containing protein [Peptococcaceae bacterium 1198_IL3148]
MRKITYFLMITLAMVLLTGCAGEEKKPEMKPETIVVPEVSSIPFDIIELQDAPAVVRKVAKAIEKEESFNWITTNGSGYILIKPTVEIERIEQRVPSENYAWINVKLKQATKTTTDDHDKDEPAIAEFNLKNTPNAVGFQFNRAETSATGQQTAVKKTEAPVVEKAKVTNQPQPNQATKEVAKNNDNDDNDDKQPAIRITNPMPGDAVSSPISISGQVGFKSADARVRVLNSSGRVLAEKPVAIEDNEFTTVLSFPPPANQEQGTVEAFLINPKDNSEVSRISIYVTLLPSQ